jgi:hypothetical protein
MRRVAVVVVGLAGCFGPSLGNQPFKCGEHGECPPDYMCDRVSGFCTQGPATNVDAPTGGQPDARIPVPDARPGPDVPVVGIPDAHPGPDVPVVGMPDAPIVGVPDAPACVTHCEGDDLVTCTPGGSVRTTCAVGCTETGGPPACLFLVPTNLTQSACKTPATTDQIHIASNRTIDTGQCGSGETGGVPVDNVDPPLCIYRAASYTVDASVTLRFIGPRVPILVATHQFILAGTIDVGAQGHAAGPGSPSDQFAKGTGADAADPVGGSGGGGGGAGHDLFGGNGGLGTFDFNGAAGGEDYGVPELSPIEPGAFGGAGALTCSPAGPACPDLVPGAGGGAVQIVGCDTLAIGAMAVVNAGGGGGSGGPGSQFLGPPSGGSGGGSGGAILIEAPIVTAPAGSALGALGGGGGGGGGLTLDATVGEPGKPGGDGSCAVGKRCAVGLGGAGGGGQSPGGAGGNGGSDTAPEDGESTGDQVGNDVVISGGGGGGSAGRIRINTRRDKPPPVLDGFVDPTPTLGDIVRRR